MLSVKQGIFSLIWALNILIFAAYSLTNAAFSAPPPGTDLNSPIAQWFESLQSYDGKSCCGLGDCRAVEAQWKDGHWWAWIKQSYLIYPDKPSYSMDPPQFVPDFSHPDKELVQVPDKIVLHRDDNKTGHSILCASPVQPATVMYCFIPDVGI